MTTTTSVVIITVSTTVVKSTCPTISSSMIYPNISSSMICPNISSSMIYPNISSGFPITSPTISSSSCPTISSSSAITIDPSFSIPSYLIDPSSYIIDPSSPISSPTICSSSSTTSPTSTPGQPCVQDVCFSAKFNGQVVPVGDVVWLSAVFQPKFSGSSATVNFTNSVVKIDGVEVSPSPPDSFIRLESSLPSCETSQLVNGEWITTAPLPGSGNTFLSAVSIPVPSGFNWANAQVLWCGDVSSPGEIAVQIAAAVYASCNMDSANPESCETQTQYRAGVPKGCLDGLITEGTVDGGSDFSISSSPTFAVCKA